ncbi:MAG: homospermidine synthase [Alphaproteobacteria bacterium]|nr:homospermidine synthase [Alphaproteobacteria bacterium]
MTQFSIHARFDGPIVILGFGSIGRGIIPLIERHLEFNKNLLTVVAPTGNDFGLLKSMGLAYIEVSLTRENYRDVLKPPLFAGGKQGLIINLAVNVSSLDIMRFAKEIGCLYIDTAIELWPDFYDNPDRAVQERTDYSLRESVLALERQSPGGPTIVTCCGANPGFVSWLVKEALLKLADDTGQNTVVPESASDWAHLAQRLGVKGIHIAERDTQRSAAGRKLGTFVNTWSVEAFVTETFRPAELGWGTHEKQLPRDARRHDLGCDASIYLLRAGGKTRVRSWTPMAGPQQGFLITHNESTSIADYFTLRKAGKVIYRPTCLFAYRPCDEAVLSLYDMYDAKCPERSNWHVLNEDEIVDGADELGVLIYGHSKNAFWYGSRLSIQDTRKLVPFQNATTLQVTSAVLAGVIWMIENPTSGIVDTDRMDFRRCLDIQRPYLGRIIGQYTNWTPVDDRNLYVPEELDRSDPWQFSNMIVR